MSCYFTLLCSALVPINRTLNILFTFFAFSEYICEKPLRLCIATVCTFLAHILRSFPSFVLKKPSALTFSNSWSIRCYENENNEFRYMLHSSDLSRF